MQFEAGKPELIKQGLGGMIIVFPQLDRNNQIWILGSKGKYMVERSAQPAGMDKMLGNMALEHLTGGLTGMSAASAIPRKSAWSL